MVHKTYQKCSQIQSQNVYFPRLKIENTTFKCSQKFSIRSLLKKKSPKVHIQYIYVQLTKIPIANIFSTAQQLFSFLCELLK